MIHNETCNIWTHLLGVVLFATITITMASGWGHKRMPALPESWVTGADEARRGLVRRTDAARTAAADAAHNLADLGARLAEKAHLLDWTHQWPEHLLDWTHQWPSSHRGDAEEREASTIGASSPGAPPTVATPERRDPRADDADDEFERVSESNGVEQECLGEEEKDEQSAEESERRRGKTKLPTEGKGKGISLPSASGSETSVASDSDSDSDSSDSALDRGGAFLASKESSASAPLSSALDSLRHASASLAEIARRVGDHASVPGSTLAAQTRSASLAALARAKSLVAALRERASKAEAEAEELGSEAAHELSRLFFDALDREAARLADALTTVPSVSHHDHAHERAPRWPMYVFLAGAIVCLTLSAACHTLACVSGRVSAIVWRVDYVGIAVLIVASFYPVVFYSFMCVPGIRFAYLFVASGLGVATLFVTLLDRFQAPEYSPFRAAMFCALGGCGSFPILHQTWFTWEVKPTPIAVMLWMELLMGACYLSGAVIYARLVPERWKPGRFDIAFSSHNIFHVLVVMGAYVHYRAALVLMAWRDHRGCDADVKMLRKWYVTGGGYLGEAFPWAFAGERASPASGGYVDEDAAASLLGEYGHDEL